MTAPVPPAHDYAYVGSRTTRERNARGDGITVYRLGQRPGVLEPVQVLGDLVNPSFLALNAAGDRLYSVHGDRSEVSVFEVDRQSGRLRFLQQQDCEGRNPVHLALDPSGRWLLVSNHLTGTLAVMPVHDDGTLGPVQQHAAMTGEPGPHRVEQPFAKPHFNPFDPSGRFVVVPDKGLDRVFTLRFEAGRLTPSAMGSVATKEGAGPRHLAFDRAGTHAYVVNELDSTVTAYSFDAVSGAMVPYQRLSTVPDSHTGDCRASEIELHPRGHVLYASNRGHDSIAVFAIDAPAAPQARLRLLNVHATQGRTPRFFTVSPDGTVLFALNEDSDAIVAFGIAPDGDLHPLDLPPVHCGSPVCMVFSR